MQKSFCSSYCLKHDFNCLRPTISKRVVVFARKSFFSSNFDANQRSIITRKEFLFHMWNMILYL
jgi:hypothetical protein